MVEYRLLARYAQLVALLISLVFAIGNQHVRAKDQTKEQKQQYALQKKYEKLIVGKWAKSAERCDLLPEFIFEKNGKIVQNDSEGWWRLTGSTLYTAGFFYDFETGETGKSGAVSSWSAKIKIRHLTKHVFVMANIQLKGSNRYVRCRN